jgi:hypothetical protein
MIQKQKKKTSFFKEGGGVCLFLVCLSFIYFHGMHKKDLVYKELVSRKAFLEEQRSLAYLEQSELELLIKSYSDPASLEMVLMKGLGMVPKGQIKVYFKKDE